MVKKSLIAIALMGFLATTVMAGDLAQNPWKFDDEWPSTVVITYEAFEICQIPVYMDVGMYVEMKDCDKKEIVLVQVPCQDIGQSSFPCYHDCVDVELRANFDVQLGLELYKIGSVIDQWKAYFSGADTITGDGNYHTVTICVDAWSANIYSVTPGDKVLVGEVAVTVKPL
jgi:hypothetical protein